MDQVDLNKYYVSTDTSEHDVEEKLIEVETELIEVDFWTCL